MLILLFALIIWLGPGVVLIYNKAAKKGGIYIGVSLPLMFAFSIWLSRAAMVYLPSGTTKVDQEIIKNIINNHIVVDHAVTFYAYQFFLFGLWLYAIVAAILSIIQRRKLAKEDNGSTEE